MLEGESTEKDHPNHLQLYLRQAGVPLPLPPAVFPIKPSKYRAQGESHKITTIEPSANVSILVNVLPLLS